MKTFTIKPRAGLVIPDPVTGKALAEEGEEKSRNSYWIRRLNDGDVVVVAAPAAPAAGKRFGPK